MGMVPEAPVAMLACARLGAPHTVVFGGFSADSLSDRLEDMGCEVLITQDEAWRRGSTVALKRTADEAMAAAPAVEHALVLRRTGGDVPMTEGRDHWWHELATDDSDCPCEPMDAEDLLYLLYTSGTTAKPKGIVHTTAGYLVGVATTHHYVFDLKPATRRLLVRGRRRLGDRPQLHRLRAALQRRDLVMYEGTPDFPDKDRWWEIVERYGVDDPLHRADRDPHAHEVGPRVRGGARPLDACGCSARSASRSTPRPGSGTTSTSAAAAARSSTPGGRPRPG